MSKPLVTLLILNWNGEEVLGECIESLLKTQYSPVEILVVDNASSDKSIEIINSYPEVRLFRNPVNVGYAAGNNIGFKMARGKYIVTLNNDIAVEPDWLNDPIRCLEEDKSIGVVSCRQMNYFRRQMIDGLYQIPTRYLIFLNYGADHEYDSSDPLHSKPGFVIGANGASAVYRKKMLEEIGYFDESYFAYHEDCDLSYRAFLGKWNCLYVPTAVVYHMRSFSFKGKARSYSTFFEKNRYRFILKNFSMPSIIAHLPFLAYLEARVFAGMLIKGEFPKYIETRFFIFVNFFSLQKRKKMNSPQIRTVYKKFLKCKKLENAPF